MIPVYKPYLNAASRRHVTKAVKSTWVSSSGAYLDKCTKHLEDMFGARVLLVSNGTCATHLIAKAIRFKYPNIKKLIVPNGIYVAAINSFLFDNYFDIKVVDLNIDTWNLDVNFEIDCNDTALLAVHNLGNIINIPEIKHRYPGLVIVEDNCEGLFGKYNGLYSGTESFASSISFFGNKNITCGEGGAFITKDDDVYEYIKCISTQGQSSQRFIHDYLGYNYRLTNIQAALLFSQLESAEKIMGKKRTIFKKYQDKLDGHVLFQKEHDNTEHSSWMFGIRIPNGQGYLDANKFFHNKGIETRPMFYPLSVHKHIKDHNVTIESENVSKLLNKECIILPSYPALKSVDIKKIVTAVKQYAKMITI